MCSCTRHARRCCTTSATKTAMRHANNHQARERRAGMIWGRRRAAMIDRLYTLPDWALIAFWAALLAGIMVGLPFLTQRVPCLRPSPDNSDFVLRLQATLFTMTSFVVAFTLVQAEFNYRKVDALVLAEASHIN